MYPSRMERPNSIGFSWKAPTGGAAQKGTAALGYVDEKDSELEVLRLLYCFHLTTGDGCTFWGPKAQSTGTTQLRKCQLTISKGASIFISS